MKEFKGRCSKLNHIKLTSITDNQVIEVSDLSNKEKRTEKQQSKLDSLIHKRDNPELMTGTKTYCKQWLKEELYKRRKIFSSKYTEKGNITEDNSIDFIAQQLNLGMLFKNEEHFSNDFIEGTPDVLIDIVIDAKNSWDHDTFPLFETEIPDNDYYGQLQGYMHLTGRKKAKLIYVLSDTPINIIEREAYYWCKNNGYEELDIEIYKKFIREMTYQDIPDNLKIKIFEIDYNQKYIDDAIKGIKLCRIYIEGLIKNMNQ